MFRHRSIGREVLIPIVGIQAATVVGVAIATATLSAARAEREILARIAGAAEVVERAAFPLTGPVVDQMRRLSGAEFVVLARDGRVSASSLPGVASAPEGIERIPDGAVGTSVEALPRLVVDAVEYFALAVRSKDGVRTLILTPRATLDRARWESVPAPFLLGAASLGLTTAATYWVASRIGRRLGAMRERVARIAEGEFVDVDPGPNPDEVRALAMSINHMSAQLRSMSASIGRSERSRLLAQVAAGLAHGLRNSIGGARMSIQLHAKRCVGREGDLSLDVALRQLTMTEGQIRGLLSLGKNERRPKSPSRLDLMLREVAALVEPTAKHAGVDLRLVEPVAPQEASADVEELQAAVLNVALNAVEAGKHVTLSLESGRDEASIVVGDDGPGPPESVGGAMFEPFVTAKPEGVGLGLALARHVAEEHGGRLSWSREGGRTLFRMTLPTIPSPKGVLE